MNGRRYFLFFISSSLFFASPLVFSDSRDELALRESLLDIRAILKSEPIFRDFNNASKDLILAFDRYSRRGGRNKLLADSANQVFKIKSDWELLNSTDGELKAELQVVNQKWDYFRKNLQDDLDAGVISRGEYLAKKVSIDVSESQDKSNFASKWEEKLKIRKEGVDKSIADYMIIVEKFNGKKK